MRIILFISVLCSLTAFAQKNYGDPAFYLVDSLDLNDMTLKDRHLVDSCLTLFHSTKSDTNKIQLLKKIVGNSYDPKVWYPYNKVIYKMAREYVEIDSFVDEREEIVIKRALAIALNNRAYYNRSRGLIDKAMDDYTSSYKNFEKLYNEYGQTYDGKSTAKIINNIGFLIGGTGDMQGALEKYEESLRLKKKIGDKMDISRSYNNIGYVHLDHGDEETALRYFEKSLEILPRDTYDNTELKANVFNNIGSIYRKKNQLDSARLYFDKAYELKKSINDRKGISMAIKNIGTVYTMQGKDENAMEYYQEALDISMQVNYIKGISIIYYEMGLLKYTQDSLDVAEKYVRSAYDYASRISFPPYQKNASKLLSSINLQHKDSSEAEKNIMEMMRLNDRIFELNFFLLSEHKKELFFDQLRPDYGWFFDFVLSRKKINAGITKKAFNTILQTKGLLLKSSTAMRNAILKSQDEELIRSYNKWIGIRKLIVRKYNSGEETKELEKTANDMEIKIVSRSKEVADLDRLHQLSWKDIQNELKEGEAAIEFIRFNHYNGIIKNTSNEIVYCALILTPKCTYPRMVELFYEDSLETILEQEGDDKNHVSVMYGTRKNANPELYELIWKPLEAELMGIKKVCLSPDGLLHKLSFNAIQKKKGVRLCDLYDLEMKSSTSKLVFGSESNVSLNEQISIFGGIDYDSDQNTESKDTSTENSWNYLEGTLLEVGEIEKILSDNKYTVKSFKSSFATEKQFKNIAPRSNILHVATHGFFYQDPNEIMGEFVDTSESEQNLLFRGKKPGSAIPGFAKSSNPLMRSGLAFAGANKVWNQTNIEGEDGVLTAAEVATIDMRNTDLVVLSACETGLGDIKGSEGVYGLQRSFKMAGVKYLIMSLWQVPDKETAEFMTTFYKHLTENNDIKKSFNLTQKEMRKKYDPYYWAAFILIE